MNNIQESKYYTPDLEDLCVGYECEVWWDLNNKDCYGIPEVLDWWTIITVQGEKDAGFRTLYLTKEQVESEGFIFSHRFTASEEEYFQNFYHKTVNDLHYTVSLTQDNIIKLSSWSSKSGSSTLFRGKCRCINDFRKILKLLEIK